MLKLGGHFLTTWFGLYWTDFRGYVYVSKVGAYMRKTGVYLYHHQPRNIILIHQQLLMYGRKF